MRAGMAQGAACGRRSSLGFGPQSSGSAPPLHDTSGHARLGRLHAPCDAAL